MTRKVLMTLICIWCCQASATDNIPKQLMGMLRQGAPPPARYHVKVTFRNSSDLAAIVFLYCLSGKDSVLICPYWMEGQYGTTPFANNLWPPCHILFNGKNGAKVSVATQGSVEQFYSARDPVLCSGTRGEYDLASLAHLVSPWAKAMAKWRPKWVDHHTVILSPNSPGLSCYGPYGHKVEDVEVRLTEDGSRISTMSLKSRGKTVFSLKRLYTDNLLTKEIRYIEPAKVRWRTKPDWSKQNVLENWFNDSNVILYKGGRKIETDFSLRGNDVLVPIRQRLSITKTGQVIGEAECLDYVPDSNLSDDDVTRAFGNWESAVPDSYRAFLQLQKQYRSLVQRGSIVPDRLGEMAIRLEQLGKDLSYLGSEFAFRKDEMLLGIYNRMRDSGSVRNLLAKQIHTQIATGNKRRLALWWGYHVTRMINDGDKDHAFWLCEQVLTAIEDNHWQTQDCLNALGVLASAYPWVATNNTMHIIAGYLSSIMKSEKNSRKIEQFEKKLFYSSHQAPILLGIPYAFVDLDILAMANDNTSPSGDDNDNSVISTRPSSVPEKSKIIIDPTTGSNAERGGMLHDEIIDRIQMAVLQSLSGKLGTIDNRRRQLVVKIIKTLGNKSTKRAVRKVSEAEVVYLCSRIDKFIKWHMRKAPADKEFLDSMVTLQWCLHQYFYPPPLSESERKRLSDQLAWAKQLLIRCKVDILDGEVRPVLISYVSQLIDQATASVDDAFHDPLVPLFLVPMSNTKFIKYQRKSNEKYNREIERLRSDRRKLEKEASENFRRAIIERDKARKPDFFDAKLIARLKNVYGLCIAHVAAIIVRDFAMQQFPPLDDREMNSLAKIKGIGVKYGIEGGLHVRLKTWELSIQ